MRILVALTLILPVWTGALAQELQAGDTTRIISGFGSKTFSDSETFTLSSNLSLTTGALATPLPGALPLYAIVLGLVALLIWRKREGRQHSRPASWRPSPVRLT